MLLKKDTCKGHLHETFRNMGFYKLVVSGIFLLPISIYLCVYVQQVTKFWTVHEASRHVKTCFMGLYLFSLVQPQRLNLPVGLTSAVV